MKRYKFGLGGVLRLRQMEEEQARASMLEAERAAEEATAALNARLEAIGAALVDGGHRSGPEFRHERDQLERHALAVSAARAAEANALSAMRVSRVAWEEAAKAVRALERLDERHRAAWRFETTRAAQLATDEVAQTHHGRSPR